MKDKIYTHKRTGNKYKVICVGVNVETRDTEVAYKGLLTGEIWMRDINIFNERFNLDSEHGND